MADGSLSNRVYDEILSRILGGRMKPGDVFNRRQVAAELRVSVAPVLEAMLELEAEGLIESLPRRGTRVRMPSAEDVWGQLMVREAIECQAARLYHGEPVSRHGVRLTRFAAALDNLDARSVPYVREEIRFHHYLVSLANCPPLTAAFERVVKLGLLHAANTLEADASQPRPDHGALVEALMSATPDAAESVVRAHVRAGNSRLYGEQQADAGTIPSLPVWLGGRGAE
jgi:DNA-binding GntR family transcriptional regulator